MTDIGRIGFLDDIEETRWCWECGGSFRVKRGDYGKLVTCPWCRRESLLTDGWPRQDREQEGDQP